MKFRYFIPLIGHVVPTVAIGFGHVIPASGIAGMNPLTVGFAASVVGSCLACGAGVRRALRDRDRMDRDALG